MPALLTWWTLDVKELAPEAHSDAVAAIGVDLLRRLAEEQRRYHTRRHIVEMFWALEDLEHTGAISAREGVVGRIATWFHDAVYEPLSEGAGANEAASAELADRNLAVLGFRPDDIDVVRTLVLATEHHHPATDGDLGAAFHDADLWILSAPEDRFDEYCVQVREEYSAVPDDEFRRGRATILQPFLERDTIYATKFGRTHWEARARLNLARELDRLRAA
jgi:predicted metal-dependent HD superfamily phosphohydrolase